MKVFNVESSPQNDCTELKSLGSEKPIYKVKRKRTFSQQISRLKLQPMMNFLLYPREINVVAKYPLIILDGALVLLLHLLAFHINFYF